MKSDLNSIFYGGPAALIKGKKNTCIYKKINRMEDFFINESGIYELNSDYEYKMNNQPISIFNSHDNVMDKEVISMINKLWRKRKKNEIELLNYLKKIEPSTSIAKTWQEAFHIVADKQQHHAIDIDTDKYLSGHTAYSPKAIREGYKVIFKGECSVRTLNPPKKIPIPIILVIGGVLVLAIISQHISEWAGNLVGFVTGHH